MGEVKKGERGLLTFDIESAFFGFGVVKVGLVAKEEVEESRV